MESSVNEKEHVEMVYIPQGELIKDEIIYSITTYPNSDYVEFETTVYHQKIHTRILTTGKKAEVIGKEKFKLKRIHLKSKIEIQFIDQIQTN